MKRSIRIAAIDPGLMSLGLVAVDTDTVDHRISAVMGYATSGTPGGAAKLVNDERIQRARELRPWIRNALRTVKPDAVVMEEFGFLRGQHATACLAMAAVTIAHEVDALDVPLIGVTARVWRDELAGLRGTNKGLTKSERAARGKEREKRAHAEALRRVPDAHGSLDGLPAYKTVHILDALGLFCWGITQPTIKGLIYG